MTPVLGRLFKRKQTNLDMTQFMPLPEQGYLVGGAVRDALLERPFEDLDWLVPDPEAEARRAAEMLEGSFFPLDETRGHWRVLAGERVRDYIGLEGSVETNLSQRDFTINALALSLKGEVIDPLGGQKDLRRRTVRRTTIEALRDDPLRALRGVRFVTTLGFSFGQATKDDVKEVVKAQLSGNLPVPAGERVREEVSKIILAEGAGQGFSLLEEVGLLELYLPELARARTTEQGGFHHLDVLGHSLEALNQLVQGFPDADLALRWATLLHDVGKPATKTYDESGRFYHFYGHDKLGAELTQDILTRLRYPGSLTKRASNLVRYHMVQLPQGKDVQDRAVRRFVHRRGELLPDLLKLMLADREAARGPRSSAASRQAYRLAIARVLEALDTEPPTHPLLSGREIMDLLGLSEGPRVGEAVRFLREAEAVGDVRTPAEAKAALKRYALHQGWTEADS